MLYTPDKADRWPQLKNILGDRIKTKVIEKQWDEFLRLTSSIRLGEVRDKSFESQNYRVSGLNLVVAAIILWNTLHLEEAIAEVEKRRAVPDKYRRYLSPLR